MAIKGVDTATVLNADVLAKIKKQGYSFVGRYYSKNDWKVMKTAESDLIASAGLKRVMVYENAHNNINCFTKSLASQDAGDAITQAKRVGQPSSPIYFAVDYDASAADVNGGITEYFKTVKTLLASAGYSLGAYGSSLVCKTLKELPV